MTAEYRPHIVIDAHVHLTQNTTYLSTDTSYRHSAGRESAGLLGSKVRCLGGLRLLHGDGVGPVHDLVEDCLLVIRELACERSIELGLLLLHAYMKNG